MQTDRQDKNAFCPSADINLEVPSDGLNNQLIKFYCRYKRWHLVIVSIIDAKFEVREIKGVCFKDASDLNCFHHTVCRQRYLYK